MSTHYTQLEYVQVMELLESDRSLKTFEDALSRVRAGSKAEEKKKHKYGAKPTMVGDIRFDSKAEAKRYEQLKLMEKAGLIVNLELQPKFDFVVNGMKLPRTWYKADFRYVDVKTDDVIVEDVKGMITPIYQLKKKLMMACHGIEIREVKA